MLQVLGGSSASEPGTFLWLLGMTITNTREVQIPEDTSTENRQYVEKCFGSDTPVIYLNETCIINTRYPLAQKPTQQNLCTIS